jgi:streptogramin lyase
VSPNQPIAAQQNRSVSFPALMLAAAGLLSSGCTTSSTAISGAAAGVPALTLSASTLSFGAVTTGSSSAAQTVTVTNTGTAALTVANIAITGDFSDTSNGCSTSLAPNATCQVSVIFTPAAVGSRTGSLSLTSNTSASPQSVALTGTGAAPVVYTGLSFQVTVKAGNKPISGTSISFYAAGVTGNGLAPTLLPIGQVLSNASGVAVVPAKYNCPSASSLVYVVGSGGTVSGASAANTNILLMAALGTCSSIASGANYVLDEATSVAAVEALAQFYAPGGLIGSSATNQLGLANAFVTAATLADPVAGTSPGPSLPGNAVTPTPRVNSIANILNACVVSSSNCASFYTATAQGSTLATNTLDAAYFLALHPANNVASLYTQSLASTAYAPVLPTLPNDWTMFVTYTDGGLDNPSGIGVDSKGNVWVASYFNAASEFTNTGVPVFPNGITGYGLNNSYGLAIDLNNNVWIPNEQPFTATGIGSVTELASNGTAVSGAAGYVNGGLDYPLSVAIDPNGTVWVVDYGNSHVTLLNSSGTPISGASGYTTPLFAFPVAVAVDANHFGWIVNQSSNNVTKVAPDGSSFVNYSCCELASGIAIDQGDNIWVADYFGDTVSLVTNSGTVIASNYTAGGSIYHPQGIAVDGAGNVWVANYRAPYLSELSGSTSKVPGSALSPAAGLGADANLLEAYALALDASGNIWVSNQGSNTVTKFIGLAVPVKTPLSGLPQLP